VPLLHLRRDELRPPFAHRPEHGDPVQQLAADIAGAERPINAFETLTLAPIDRRLIDLNMLSGEELSWLNEYHARVRHEVRSQLDEATKVWLDSATAPLSL